MRPFTLGTFVLASASTVWAQDTGNMNSTTGPTFNEGETVVHTVTVGLQGHTFDPASLIANPGDKVRFEFYAGNHSFIQSLYGWACIPEQAVDGTQGVNSGQFPNATNSMPVVWNLTINDTNPIWYYCGAPGSCINYGMLGAINPTNASQVLAQQDLAKQSRYILYPGQSLPAAAAASVSALAAKIFPQYEANNNNTSQNTTTPDAGTSHHHGLSGGAIAGIVVGAVAALAIIGVLVFFLGRNKGQIKALRESRVQQEPEQPPAPRPEMVVDGVTYVPATATGTLSSNASYLPPYNRDGRLSPELRSKSPDSTVAPFSPPVSMQQHFSGQFSNSPHMSYQHSRSYTETSELGIHVPQPRHELPSDPPFSNHDIQDIERGTRQT